MSETAIRVEGLSKRYHIGTAKGSYRTLRDTLTDGLAAPARRIALLLGGRPPRQGAEQLWALKDVSFEVGRGEVVGIIGHNGAGKSTLLKILSRITEPTCGAAEIRGRVGSLLEVGTGFHPELTGRENVFLNGAILGMRRGEIARKFDEIVSFAEVERFIDTPVKHYSSGMHMRLAFSVAAHLEPEILLIDEVLAVGDIAFQKKCMGKMGDVASQGRTVLFVSHNLGAIKDLCQTGVVLERGAVKFHGPVVEGLALYSQSLFKAEEDDSTAASAWRGIFVNGKANGHEMTVQSGAGFTVEAELNLTEGLTVERLVCNVKNAVGEFVVNHRLPGEALGIRSLKAGRYCVKVEVPALNLSPGVYSVFLRFVGRDPSGVEHRVTSQSAVLDISGKPMSGRRRPLLVPELDWEMTREAKRESLRAVS
jgi:ABC-type polysaccharide/polyol phosphate transport system ATPase subunit